MHDRGVSIVVPIFNMEKHIHRCLDSIIGQSYTNIEIILVDDGSEDSSASICDEYGKKFDNIRVIHQDNTGLAGARLNGCKLASNRMIMFVDSDDFIGSDLVRVLVNKMIDDDSELVCSHLVYVRDGLQTKNNPFGREGVFNKEDIIQKLIDNEYQDAINVEVSMCAKLFKKDKLIEALSKVEKGLTYGEDIEELLLYINEIQKVTLVETWEYFYVQNSNSMSQSVSLEFFDKISGLYTFFHNNELFSENTDIVKQSDYFVRSLLVKTITSLFPNIDFGYLSYVPPYEIIPQNCRLAVYGAGRVGRSMMKCLLNSNYVKTVLWVDSNVRKSLYGMDIESPEKLKSADFDYILIAVAIEDYAEQIKDNLLKIGVSPGEILWKKPFGG